MYNPYPQMFGNYITRSFGEIFPDYETFLTLKEIYWPLAFDPVVKEEDLEKAYYLLTARFRNSTIANTDEE